MAFWCGAPLLPDGIPDLSSDDDPCCAGRAIDGPRGCTCWIEVHRPLGQAEIVEGLPQIPDPVEPCHDCAYRHGSPERNGDPGVSADGEDLERLAATGEPFYCHAGIRYLIGYVHPACGRPGCDGATWSPPKGDYRPPIAGRVPYQADGSPGFLCAGWILRRATLIRQRQAYAGAAAEESRGLPCGCRYVQAGGRWWQVVACPDHRFEFGPLDAPPQPDPDHAGLRGRGGGPRRLGSRRRRRAARGARRPAGARRRAGRAGRRRRVRRPVPLRRPDGGPRDRRVRPGQGRPHLVHHDDSGRRVRLPEVST
jgi:hypothetical protein